MRSARTHTDDQRVPGNAGVSRTVLASAALIASLLLVSGCGGSSAPGSRAAPAASVARIGHQFIAFASCMRSHGLPAYPDPRISSTAQVWRVTISPGDTRPGSPAYQAAQDACRRLLPAGGAPAPAGGAQLRQDLTYADCMRSHGAPEFPDADRDGAFTLPATVDQQAPRYTRAASVCESVQPHSLSILQSAAAG